MPKKNLYLSEEKIKRFQAILEQEKGKVLAEKNELIELFREKIKSPGQSPMISHPADLTPTLSALEQQQLKNCNKHLRAIQKALWRLANGDYGMCAACREPIAEERLLAVPATAHCVGCKTTQKKPEKKYAADIVVALT